VGPVSHILMDLAVREARQGFVTGCKRDFHLMNTRPPRSLARCLKVLLASLS
jgi:hypothetical protein